MEKQQRVATGHRGARIHLCGPPALGFHQPCPQLPRPFRAAILTPAIRNNDFLGFTLLRRAQGRLDAGHLVQGWNDHGNPGEIRLLGGDCFLPLANIIRTIQIIQRLQELRRQVQSLENFQGSIHYGRLTPVDPGEQFRHRLVQSDEIVPAVCGGAQHHRMPRQSAKSLLQQGGVEGRTIATDDKGPGGPLPKTVFERPCHALSQVARPLLAKEGSASQPVLHAPFIAPGVANL